MVSGSCVIDGSWEMVVVVVSGEHCSLPLAEPIRVLLVSPLRTQAPAAGGSGSNTATTPNKENSCRRSIQQSATLAIRNSTPAMAQKKALTDEELFAQFEDIPEDTPPIITTTNTTTNTATLAPNAATAKKPSRSTAHTPSAEGPDPLAELESLAARPISRPATPKLSSSSTASRNRSPRRPGTATPPSSARTSEDRPAHSYALPRRSGESTRSFHQSFTPSLEETAEHEQKAHAASLAPEPAQKSGGGGGGWWGGLFATASAAVKQAEAAVKEIQKNEEAQRWAEQVKGNVGALRGFGTASPSSQSTRSDLEDITSRNTNTSTTQAANSNPAPSPPSPTSCTPSPRPSPNTSASKST